MSRVLIPRGPCCSAKVVSSSDFENYFSDIINDYVVTGICISAQCPNILAVNISAGRGRQCGLYIENTAVCTITCLAVCDETFIFAQLNRDGMCRPCNWTFVTNLTGTPPCESQILGSAITNATTVTSVCNLARELEPLSTGSPTGTINMFGGTTSTIPTGWLHANGACRSKTTCARLFAVIGSAFGCCGCCFTLPDMRASFARGAAACCNPGTTGGADTVTLTSAQSGIVSHSHSVHDTGVCGPGGPGGFDFPSGTTTTGGTANVGAMCSHTNLPVFLEFIYIIKN